MAQTKSRSPSASSKNDLFSTSWTPDVPPPKPIRGSRDGSIVRRASLRGAEIFEQTPRSYALPTPPAAKGSPRTSSFFDDTINYGTLTPPPAPPISTTPQPFKSPLSLSRSASLRSKLPTPLSLETVTVRSEDGPLSPLYQSPSLPSASLNSLSTWQPPLPPSAEDVKLRFQPNSTYLLGEGRYARVYLAGYKWEHGESSGTLGQGHRDGETLIVEESGMDGGTWRLCAAKRMAPDRESQTMGLREAFFLRRLAGPQVPRRPLDLFQPRDPTKERIRRSGSVYIIKLIAVKEEREVPRRDSSHGRSASDLKTDQSLSRQRSSTCVTDPISSLASHPSLPALAHAAKAVPPNPSLSRWVLLLEHAPLGTVDRLLRTSPYLVGQRLWGRWAMEGAEALEWVHGKGVVHADVKPGNLLVRFLTIDSADDSSQPTCTSAFPTSAHPSLFTHCILRPTAWVSELCPSPLLSSSTRTNRSLFPSTSSPSEQLYTSALQDERMRSVEMMHYVRKGALWDWEERERLTRVGDDGDRSLAGSPYPSAWRDPQSEGVKRAGSLRVPQGNAQPTVTKATSTESLRASVDVMEGPNSADSPAGVRLWAKWVKDGHHVGRDAVSSLLSEAEEPIETSGEASVVSTASFSRHPSLSLSSPVSPIYRVEKQRIATSVMPYEDASPAMMFLDGRERVPEDVREVMRAMVDPVAGERPTAEEIRRLWDGYLVAEE